MKGIRLFLLIIFASQAFATVQAQAPEAAFVDVDELVRTAQLVELAAVYEQILETFPEDRRALLGRAAVYSWEGERIAARRVFRQVLALYPDDIDALTGLGYDYAWGGEHGNAKAAFLRTLRLDPANVAAQKGLAFNYLWSGDPQKAEAQFRAVAAAHPQDVEARRGIGQALVAQQRGREAEVVFEQALQIDPNDFAARDGVRAARDIRGPFEASVSFGNSAAGGDVDIRALQLTSFVSPKTSVRFRLDDSLSLDNPALARSGADALATFISATHEFNSLLIGTLEIGQRDLPGQFDQDIYKFEVALPGARRTWKLGYQISPHSAGFDDTLIIGGLSMPLADHLSLDATMFVAETGAQGDDEYRSAVFLEHRTTRGWTVGGGVGIGSISSVNAAADGRVTTATLNAGFPISRSVSTFLQLRWEDAPLVDFSVATIGITVRPGRR